MAGAHCPWWALVWTWDLCPLGLLSPVPPAGRTHLFRGSLHLLPQLLIHLQPLGPQPPPPAPQAALLFTGPALSFTGHKYALARLTPHRPLHPTASAPFGPQGVSRVPSVCPGTPLSPPLSRIRHLPARRGDCDGHSLCDKEASSQTLPPVRTMTFLPACWDFRTQSQPPYFLCERCPHSRTSGPFCWETSPVTSCHKCRCLSVKSENKTPPSCLWGTAVPAAPHGPQTQHGASGDEEQGGQGTQENSQKHGGGGGQLEVNSVF